MILGQVALIKSSDVNHVFSLGSELKIKVIVHPLDLLWMESSFLIDSA